MDHEGTAAKIVAEHCPDFSEAAADALRRTIVEALEEVAEIYARGYAER